MWFGSNSYIKNIRIILMNDNLKGIAVLATFLHRLDNGKGLNRDNYSTLDTEFTDPETWWNTLTETQKINVGGIAIHFNLSLSSSSKRSTLSSTRTWSKFIIW